MPPPAVNDNKSPPPADKLIQKTLSKSAVIEQHLGTGLQAMLAANDVPTVARDAVAEFVRPVADILGRMEGDVMDYARGQQVPDDVLTRLKGYSADMTSVAYSPLQVKLADSFRDFVQALGPQAEQTRETPHAVTIAAPHEPPTPANDSPWAKLAKAPRGKPKEKDGPEMEP